MTAGKRGENIRRVILLDSITAYTDPLGNITGDDPESLNANTYSVLVEALSGTIKGILTGIHLAA